MDEDPDLPDHDYESIYGHAAMHARLLARLDVTLKRIDVLTARLKAQNEHAQRDGADEEGEDKHHG